MTGLSVLLPVAGDGLHKALLEPFTN